MSPPIPGDDTLQVKGGDTIHVTYLDALDGQGRVNQTRAANATVRTGTDGALTGAASIRSDQGWPLVITDADANSDPTLRETVQVQVRDGRTQQVMTVPLTETDVNTGRFEGTLPTVFDDPSVTGADRMKVKGDDVLTATYLDAVAAEGK